MASSDPWRWLKPLAAGTQVLATGERLFRRGDRIHSIYLVQRGSVELIRTLPDGAVITLAVFVGGELAGEASLFASSYHCDATATSAAEVLRFPRNAVVDLLRSDQEAAMLLLAYMARSIQSTRVAIELRNVRPLSTRVLAWLELQPSDREGWVKPGINWVAVARLLGATHEALYRTLANLEAAGRIERGAGRIRAVPH